MTKKIVSHNQRLLKNRSTNNLLPERTENIITNCEKIITAKVIVRATSTEVFKPITFAKIVIAPSISAWIATRVENERVNIP